MNTNHGCKIHNDCQIEQAVAQHFFSLAVHSKIPFRFPFSRGKSFERKYTNARPALERRIIQFQKLRNMQRNEESSEKNSKYNPAMAWGFQYWRWQSPQTDSAAIANESIWTKLQNVALV